MSESPEQTDRNLLRALVDLRDRQIQKGRIQFGNRLSAMERMADDSAGSGQRAIVEKWLEHFSDMEKELDKDIASVVPDHPMYDSLVALRGIDKTLAAKMVAMIDINRANTVSALWRYCGYGVIDGERERATKGEKLHYNKRLKSTCYLVATSFMRCNSPYRAIYDEARVKYDRDQPEWTDLHKHRASLRKMIKVFLSHLWERWRIIEGLPTRPPYVVDYMGHEHRYQAVDFGWPVLEIEAKTPE